MRAASSLLVGIVVILTTSAFASADATLKATFFKAEEVKTANGTIKVGKPNPNKSYWIYFEATGDPGTGVHLNVDGASKGGYTFEEGKTKDWGYAQLHFTGPTTFKVVIAGGSGKNVKGRGPWAVTAVAKYVEKPADWRPDGKD